MPLIKDKFTDFQEFNNVIVKWDLDFRLLSKNDFHADLMLFHNDFFELIKIKLNGKIEHRGTTPIGYRTIGIPINYGHHFIWLDKNNKSDQLFIFPKNGTIDAISYNNFEIYTISVKEEYLFKLMDDHNFEFSKEIFNEDEQLLPITKSLTNEFNDLASLFFNEILRAENPVSIINNLILFLLNYIENNETITIYSNKRKRDIAIKKAVKIINETIHNTPSIQELCDQLEISERTLEYVFLQQYQVSPSQYIKAIKLNKIKEELHLTKEKNIKISTIAGKYGFWHMGQFAKDFKKQFGVLPSSILKI